MTRAVWLASHDEACSAYIRPSFHRLQDLCFFLETPGPRGAHRLQQPKSEVLLFLKAFDPKKHQALQVCLCAVKCAHVAACTHSAMPHVFVYLSTSRLPAKVSRD